MSFWAEQNVEMDGHKTSGVGMSFQVIGATNAEERRPEIECIRCSQGYVWLDYM